MVCANITTDILWFSIGSRPCEIFSSGNVVNFINAYTSEWLEGITKCFDKNGHSILGTVWPGHPKCSSMRTYQKRKVKAAESRERVNVWLQGGFGFVKNSMRRKLKNPFFEICLTTKYYLQNNLAITEPLKTEILDNLRKTISVIEYKFELSWQSQIIVLIVFTLIYISL